MGREQQRMRRKLEKNPIVECNKIQQKYCPSLMRLFSEVKDPRDQRYITYSTKTMLGAMYYKSLGGITSMRDMTDIFTNESIVKNLYTFMKEEVREYLPHGVTQNEFLERLDPSELEQIIREIVRSLIRRKTFDDARVFGKWLVFVDGTELDEGPQQKNEYYLSRCYNKGTNEEKTKYHRSVLEAKIYFGNGIVCSIGTEPIENSESNINKSAEIIKQDCESKAFARLAKKIKEYYPRLPIIIVADALYVTQNVLEICKKNDWEYIFRYKEGCAPSIAKEFRDLPEKEIVGNDIKFQNGIIFQKGEVNLVYFTEIKTTKGKTKTTEFAWITSITITTGKVRKIIRAGRDRWKIENQGFNRQKHWQGSIEHACSWNERAQKNHYLIDQIADFMKQLYEYFYLKKNGIEKKQKNISSELLSSFDRHLTNPEDIHTQDTGKTTA